MMKERDAVVETVKKVMPAVVSITVSKKLEAIERELREFYPLPFNETAPLIPPDKIDSRGMVQVGGGSGFIIKEEGIILTNKHVISEPQAEYTVVTDDGTKYRTRILARDPIDDIAILRLESPKQSLPTITLGNSSKILLGEPVLAFGNSLGLFKNTVSMGIISGLSRSIEARPHLEAPVQELRGLIQTDAAINPGNSGGPLTNVYGEVIGINTAVVAGAQNIGFAIPINAASRDIRDLEKYGKIRRPLLGIRYLMLNPDLQVKLKLPVDYGALIIRGTPLEAAIAPGSPAEKAGLREKDIVLEWNSQKITDSKNIQDYLEECNVGDVINLIIQRSRRKITKKVVLVERK